MDPNPGGTKTLTSNFLFRLKLQAVTRNHFFECLRNRRVCYVGNVFLYVCDRLCEGVGGCNWLQRIMWYPKLYKVRTVQKILRYMYTVRLDGGHTIEHVSEDLFFLSTRWINLEELSYLQVSRKKCGLVKQLRGPLPSPSLHPNQKNEPSFFTSLSLFFRKAKGVKHPRRWILIFLGAIIALTGFHW